MEHERHNDLVPARLVSLCAHLDELSQPEHVLDLLLLELEVRIEASVVELFLKGEREATSSLFHHSLICYHISIQNIKVRKMNVRTSEETKCIYLCEI